MRSKSAKLIMLMVMLVLSLQIISSTMSDIVPVDNAVYNTSNVNFTFTLTNYTNSTTCSLFIDQIEEQSKSAESSNTFTETLTEGVHEWYINCSDENNSESIIERTINIDLSAPIIVLENPINNANLTNLTNVTFVATDNFATSMNCILTLDDAIQAITAINGTSKIVNISADSGMHYWNISCQDSVGNANISGNRIFTIENETVEEEIETPFLNISLNKETYSLGEAGTFTINALNGSNMTIEIGTSSGGWFTLGETITITNGTFPRTESMTYTTEVGTYAANTELEYQNTTLTDVISFEVENSITISVVGDKSVDVDEPTELEAYVNGGIGEYTYLWTLSDGTTKTNDTINMSYENSGSYIEKLTVTDEEGNSKSLNTTITVKNVLELAVTVKDINSGSVISGARIELANREGITNSKGQYTFYISRGTYRLTVLKSNYEVLYDEIWLRENITYLAEIEGKDVTAPSIELISPADKQEFNSKSIDVKFKVSDQGDTTCVLYTAEKDESWYTKKGTKIVSDNTEQIFSLTGLDYKDYKWKIECEDSDKNSKATEERTFKIIDEVIDVKTTFSETEFTDELYAIIDTLSTKGLHERRVIDVLDIEKNIKSAIVTIQRAYRDINDATYNNVLSEKEKEDKIQTLETKISDTYNSIIVNVNVLENKAFIKYIRDPELKEVSDKYSTIKKYLDKEKFFEASKLTQSKATISTTARNVELEYFDGTKKTITLVVKELKYVNSTYKLRVVESIPKELAETTDDLTIITNHKILEKDPLIEFDNPQKIIYYFDEQIDLENIDKAQTVLFEDSYTKAVTSITGNSIFDFNVNMDKKGYLIVLIMVLVLVYAGHSHIRIDKMRFFYYVLFGDKKIHTINLLINDALDNLEVHDLDKAHFIYREIKLYYEKLSTPSKNEVYQKIRNLCTKLDHGYSQKLVSDIENNIKADNIGKARYYYHQLEEVYKRLDEDYKTELFEKIKTLQMRIAS